MNNRQNINLPYRPRNPRFSQNRNQRPFIRPQAQHNETRIHQRNQNDDRYNFPSTSPSNFADQSVADQNIHHAYEHGSVAMYSSFPVMQNNQLINQPRIRHPNPQTWPRTSVPDPQFGTNVTGTNMQHGHDGTQIMPSIQPTHIDSGLHQQLDNSSMRREMVTSTPSFGNAAFSNTIQPSMQNQYIDHNNFTLQPDTCNIIPQNVGNNKELYFPKVQHNQSQQVKIPGLDLCPDNTDQAPFIQDQHHPVLKQGQESSMQNVEHTGLMSFPLQSEPMRDNRQQNYMGFQDIQTSQVGRFQSPNLSSPMMSLPTPPVPFLQQDSITQPMNNRIPTPITQQNFQFERLPNSNMFPPSQGSAPMQQYPRQPSQLKTFTSEPRFQSVSQPYHDQSRGMLTQFPPMQQNMKPPLEDNLKPRDYKISPMTGKEMDMQWIHSWLIRKGKQKMKEEMPLKADTNMYEVQEKTKRMMFLMASLQKQIRLLSQCERGQFDEEMRTASKLKEEMDGIKKYLSMVNKDILKIKVKRRAQKRERMRKQRQEKYFDKQRDLEKREQLHKEIDERLNKMYKANEDKRQEMDLKKTADKILSEVRKKTQDVTRATDLLKNLKKLRKLRKDRLLQQGVHSKQETDVDFEDKIQDCLTVLTKQKEVYNAENRALRVMLETEQEENQEKEREKRKQILHSQELKKQKKKNRLLFGDTEPCDINDPMFVFSQYYEQASLNLDSLIQIRHDWDRFCVSDTTPGGTKIPDGFVIPEKPTSNIWASSLKEET